MRISDRTKQIYEYRWYEGEHAYFCNLCGARHVEFSYGESSTRNWRSQQGPYCDCGEIMIWEGWSGESDISTGLRSLIQDGHLMAAIVIIAAFVEYQINNLLWAVLVDAGLSKNKASAIANGNLPRGDAIRMIRNLLERKIGNIVFPVRNEVAHGRAFGRSVGEYAAALDTQLAAIHKWISSVKGDHQPRNFKYSELDRWLLSMEYWIAWQQEWWKSHKPK